MKQKSDLQSITKIGIDAIIGIIDIVEQVHSRILQQVGLSGNEKYKTGGITGLIYNTIRKTTSFTGKGIDILLSNFTNSLPEKKRNNNQEAIISALNGVLGDYLHKTENSLSIKMQFIYLGEIIDEKLLFEALQNSNKKLVIMIHGLCMNNNQWNMKGHNHAISLEKDIDIIPIYLRYNTGLHVSENGKQFNKLMEKLIQNLPSNTEFHVVAHSMGGLLLRSALYYTETKSNNWQNKLKKIIFLGTPHHGAPLEKVGNLLDLILDSNSYSKAFSRIGKIRSSGVTDMRFGNIIDEDWNNEERFKYGNDKRVPIPLPNINVFTIAATNLKSYDKIKQKIVGDGLVPIDSALGKHRNPNFELLIPESNKFIVYNTNHLELLNNLEVYEKLKLFLNI